MGKGEIEEVNVEEEEVGKEEEEEEAEELVAGT